MSNAGIGASTTLSDLMDMVMASPTVPPSFERCDLLATIVFMGVEGEPVSRFALMERLNLKEGPAKTLMKRLEQNGLIERIGNRGHQLTAKGRNLNEKIRARLVSFKEVRAPGLSLAQFAYGIQLRGTAGLVESGIEQRDRALLVGATGATTLVCRNNELKVPSVSGKAVEKRPLKVLLSEFTFQDGDILILGTGDSLYGATRGAFNAALSLLLRLVQ